MEDIGAEEEVNHGIKIIVSVVELNEEYWSGYNLETPEDRDEVPVIEFYVIKDGLKNALAHVEEVIEAFEAQNNE